MADYKHIRPELSQMLPSYKIIRDCIKQLVKECGPEYLPKFLPTDDAAADVARYNAYKLRAVFYDVTGRTLEGLVGQIFSKAPVVETPAVLDAVVKDANGDGVSLEGLAQYAAALVVAYGRAGLLCDYPKMEGPASLADIQSGKVRPTLLVYEPDSVINWRYTKRGGKKIASLIVIKEKADTSTDDFDTEAKDQYRVLKLVKQGDKDVYEITIRGEKPAIVGTNGSRVDPVAQGTQPAIDDLLEGPIYPVDYRGEYLNEIPFTFIGSMNNNADIDKPPLLALAHLNIAHYRNSADFEESCFVVGQPTIAIAGLTEEWVKNVLKGKVNMGSRGGIPLPTGASAEILQVQENTMVQGAMEHKERQMVSLGAKLVEQKQVQRTAKEAGIENAAETSVLSTIAKNVSAAFKWGLEWASLITTGTENKIEFKLNSDYEISNMSAQDRQQLISEWQSGALTFSEMRAALRKTGVATLDDDKAQAELQKEEETKLNTEAKHAESMALANAAANPEPAPGE